MKISYKWLKEYIDLDVQPEELSVILTDIGLEVESMEELQSVKGGLKGVVIGEVKTCSKHPNADKLSITTVDVGNGTVLPIVCGAPNVAAGQKVLVATVGTVLYMNDKEFEIKAAKIRGEVSEGMICAEDELGLGTSHAGIMVLPADAVAGTPAADYFHIENDVVFEIGLTPNRVDASSHIGVARDLAARLNCDVNTDKYRLKWPSVEHFNPDNNELDIEVIVENEEACPRYSGLTISGATIAESPEWLKNRLNAIGLRPINNVVDITNFVLHETGQPLHAFDANEVTGNKVVVKKLGNNTPFVTLDDVERKLDSEDLMICNTSEGMCIAGVFGGLHSGVSDKTTNIFLESAYFDPSHIRRTSKRHGLQTDASFRFERGADPNITVYALKRAALLIREIAGGKISSGIKDVYPKKIEKWVVDVAFAHVDRLIGEKIDRKKIGQILKNLEMEVIEEYENGMKVSVPTFKVDVTREADMIEEILRIYGYNNVELGSKISISVSPAQKPDLEKLTNLVADQLSAQGFSEIMNNSLTRSEYYEKNPGFHQTNNVALLNPLSSDLDVLRQTLLFGGLEVIAYNTNRKLGDLKLFEFGKVYFKHTDASHSKGLNNYHEETHLALLATGLKNGENWNTDNKAVDFFFVKGILENIFRKTGIETGQLVLRETNSAVAKYGLDYMSNGKMLASVMVINKTITDRFDIKNEVIFADVNWDMAVQLMPEHDKMYVPVPRFPSVRRDLALIVDKNVKYEDLRKAAFEAEKAILRNVGIFDVYEGDKIPEGKKSYALSFILNDTESTLTDKVIEKTMNRLLTVFENRFGATLR